MKLKCTKCRKEWNVSKLTTKDESSYICPHCTSKERRTPCTTTSAKYAEHIWTPAEKCDCQERQKASKPIEPTKKIKDKELIACKKN